MNEKWYKDKEKLYLVIVMTIYIIFGSITVYFHEPFCDEAQAWLIARDTNVLEMFSLMRGEGSPMLWHLLVNILTTLNLPYVSMKIFHLLLNVLAVYILNRYAPFNKIIKIGLTFTDVLAYQYLAIARSYVLIPLILFSIAAIYKKRHEKTITYCVLLFLLENICIYTIPLSVVLFISYVIEKIKLKKVHIKEIIIFSIKVILLLLMLSMLLKPSEDAGLYKVIIPKSFFDWVVGAIRALYSIGYTSVGVHVNYFVLAFIGLIVYVIAGLFLWKDKKTLIIFVISTIFVGGVFAFVGQPVFDRHVYIYVIIYIFCVWILDEILKSKLTDFIKKTFLAYWFSMQLAVLLTGVLLEVMYPYSNGDIITKIIKENNYESYELIGIESSRAASISVNFDDKTVLSAENLKKYTYTIWEKDFKNYKKISNENFEYILEYAEKECDGKALFIMRNSERYLEKEPTNADNFLNIASDKVELVYKENNVIQENLMVYKLKED